MKYLNENDLADILEDIDELIEKRNHGALQNILVDLHPADIADVLTHFKKDERRYLFHLLSTETASAVLTELDPTIVEQILAEVSDKQISTMVDQMDSDDAADIISELPDEVADRVLEQVPDEVSDDVKELLTYDEDTGVRGGQRGQHRQADHQGHPKGQEGPGAYPQRVGGGQEELAGGVSFAHRPGAGAGQEKDQVHRAA